MIVWSTSMVLRASLPSARLEQPPLQDAIKKWRRPLTSWFQIIASIRGRHDRLLSLAHLKHGWHLATPVYSRVLVGSLDHRVRGCRVNWSMHEGLCRLSQTASISRG